MLWGLQPVEAQATYGIAVERLRRQIHTGLLLPEEKLPAERQLSEGFGISRVTLREALRVLEADRYITVKRGAQGGAFVTDEERLSELARRRISREPGSAMRVLEFLCANEMAALALAVERHGLPEFKRMKQAVSMMEAAREPATRKQAQALFHLALGDASRNTLFACAIADGLAELFLPLNSPGTAGGGQAPLEASRALLAAFELREADKAAEALSHIHADLWSVLRTITRSAT
jgi:GntR family transcriptional regulator, transcriptional repressor for pyruvate dehydrogenase complex